jgi:hypothetical protein
LKKKKKKKRYGDLRIENKQQRGDVRGGLGPAGDDGAVRAGDTAAQGLGLRGVRARGWGGGGVSAGAQGWGGGGVSAGVRG